MKRHAPRDWFDALFGAFLVVAGILVARNGAGDPVALATSFLLIVASVRLIHRALFDRPRR